MKKRFSDQQIISILRETEAGVLSDTCLQSGGKGLYLIMCESKRHYPLLSNDLT